MVVLVACTRQWGGPPGGFRPVRSVDRLFFVCFDSVPMNQAFSHRTSTPAVGQGSHALLKGCLIRKTSVGRIVYHLFPLFVPCLSLVSPFSFFSFSFGLSLFTLYFPLVVPCLSLIIPMCSFVFGFPHPFFNVFIIFSLFSFLYFSFPFFFNRGLR